MSLHHKFQQFTKLNNSVIFPITITHLHNNKNSHKYQTHKNLPKHSLNKIIQTPKHSLNKKAKYNNHNKVNFINSK